MIHKRSTALERSVKYFTGDFRGVHGERWKKSREEEFFETISFLQCNHYQKYVEILFNLLLNYP